MGAVLDADPLVLDGLDFEPQCETDAPPHAANVALTCRHCGGVSLACRPHVDEARLHFADPLLVCIHKACGFRGAELDEVFSVRPL
ncbi:MULTISPECIES: hypothetical protein [unclassified Microbacterium]|uniref:hypothetical protein n=1 Tax=Microbacterium TaxID=33882 RepID=UPI003BA3C107